MIGFSVIKRDLVDLNVLMYWQNQKSQKRYRKGKNKTLKKTSEFE